MTAVAGCRGPCTDRILDAPSGSPSPAALESEAGSWLLPALSLALVVLTLGLAGVLIRNLVKLIVERRRGHSRLDGLRIKLVFFFSRSCCLPAIVLFYGLGHR